MNKPTTKLELFKNNMRKIFITVLHDTWGAKTMNKYTNPGNKSCKYGFVLEYEDVN